MQQSLFLLILMGQCSFFTCHLYEYHFIKEEKSWKEAQTYCTENYTDLATVSNMTDMKRLRDSTVKQDEAWIGLYSNPGNRSWHWSLPGVEFNDNETEWSLGEPNDKGGIENCVEMKNPKWEDFPCTDTFKFICYDETKQSNDKFSLINNVMTWPQAQNYCRQHHTDLVSGLNQLKELTDVSYSGKNLWIGLFRDTWRWSDGSNSSFRNWDLELFKDEDNKTCAMTVLNRVAKWNSDDCNKTKPFFCYDDKVILIKQNKTWEEALYYCRENHNDLVSITKPDEQRWVQERAKKADTPFVWLGLRYTCTLGFWFWVSDEVVNYKNWAPGQNMDKCDMSGAIDKGGQHEWFKKVDNEEFNFICSKR
ncbi:putative C-type lectin domain family 20 member A [Siniperca chuatsi]|uniref:putative C-type lectin domain family 20 member A n=1 Tax=Siniperca chuatsi TaxID=119488 RepID=UPI001CE20F6E|nr:putative C-type lectin domain family 20 member A [Siniperca chuatsi]